ncbi:MAG: diguanylate cyclase [Thermotogae bacterium]|nr:diguanylate cyclase [Thermotogota bacterium]
MRKANIYFFIFFVLSLISIIIFYFILFGSSKTAMEDNIFQSLKNNAYYKEQVIKHWFTDNINAAKIYSEIFESKYKNISEMSEKEKEKINNDMKINAVNNSYEGIGFIDKSGKFVLGYPENIINTDFSDRDYFKQAINGRPYAEVLEVSRISGNRIIVFSNPVVINNEIIGIFGIVREENIFSTLVKENNEFDKSFIKIFDENGEKIFSNDEISYNTDIYSDFTESIKSGVYNYEGVYEISENEKRIGIMNAVKIKDIKLGIIYERKYDEVFGVYENIEKIIKNIFIVIITIFIAIFLFFMYEEFKETKNRKQNKKINDFINTVFNTIGSLVAVTDEYGNIEKINSTFENNTGYTFDEVKGKNIKNYFLPEKAEKSDIDLFENFPKNKEIKWNTKNENDFITTIAVSYIKDEYGNIENIIYSATDITKNREYERELRKKSLFDPLTGVFNRDIAIKILDKNISKSKRNKTKFSIAFADLNNLKKVNDNYGHEQGDKYITDFCDILKENVREEDYICRMGGDEFLLIFPECSEEFLKNVIWKRIDEKIKNKESNEIFKLSVSVGFAEYNDETGMSSDELIAVADSRMYADKAAYKKSEG